MQLSKKIADRFTEGISFVNLDVKGGFDVADIEKNQIDHIISSLENLQFGTLTITVHDGQILQIDQTEKRRFNQSTRRKKADHERYPSKNP